MAQPARPPTTHVRKPGPLAPDPFTGEVFGAQAVATPRPPKVKAPAQPARPPTTHVRRPGPLLPDPFTGEVPGATATAV